MSTNSGVGSKVRSAGVLSDAWTRLSVWISRDPRQSCLSNVVGRVVVVAVGVNQESRTEVLGVVYGPAENEAFCTEFLRRLLKRGLSGVHLAISDALQGLKAAVAKVLGATWQRCRAHCTRNALACVP